MKIKLRERFGQSFIKKTKRLPLSFLLTPKGSCPFPDGGSSKFLFLLFALSCFVIAESNDYQSGFDAGKTLGQNTNQSEWIIKGAVGSSLFNLLGGIMAVVGAGGGDIVISDSLIPSGTPEFRMGFIEGYKKGVKSEKVGSAWLGTIAGTAFNTIVISIILYNIAKNEN